MQLRNRKLKILCGCKTAELNGEASIGGNPSSKAGVMSSQAQRLEADA